MKYSIGLVMLLLFHLQVLAQETKAYKAYFTPGFGYLVNYKSPYERHYYFNDQGISVEDYGQKMAQMNGNITGLKNTYEVDDFVSFIRFDFNDRYYKKYFANACGIFNIYTPTGSMARQIIVKDSVTYYCQIWDEKGREILKNGTGSRSWFDDKMEERTEEYQDSILIRSYGVRSVEGDTIYYANDRDAYPREGWKQFLEAFGYEVFNPDVHRLLDSDNRITIEFIVNEKGRLQDFRPLVKSGYRLRAASEKRLSAFPAWKPAINNYRPVKSKVLVPMRFNSDR